MNKILWIFLLLLCIIPIVNAGHVEIVPQASYVSICKFQMIEIPLGIENSGVDDFFRFDTDGDKNILRDLSSDSLELTSGKKESILLTLGVFDVDPGVYPIDLIIESNTEKGIIPISLEVEDCYDFTVEVINEQPIYCAGSDQNLNFDLENVGSVQDVFSLELKGIPSWMSLSNDSYTLGPEEFETINLNINPSFEIQGHYDYELKVEGLDTIATIPLNFDVVDCNPSKLEIQEKISICKNQESYHEFSVLNQESSNVSVSLSLVNAPEWVSLDVELLDVPGESFTETALVFDPTLVENPKKGNFIINVEESSFPGRDSKQVEFNFKKDNDCVIQVNNTESGAPQEEPSRNIFTMILSLFRSSEDTSTETTNLEEDSITTALEDGVSTTLDDISITQGDLLKDLIDITGLTPEDQEGTNDSNGTDLVPGLTDDALDDSLPGLFVKYSWVVALILLVLIFIVVFSRLGTFSKGNDMFSDSKVDSEEELFKGLDSDDMDLQDELVDKTISKQEVKGEPLDVLQPSGASKIVFTFMLIAVLIAIGLNMAGGLGFIREYSLYLVLGAIIGITLILILHFRENIIKFFEEEEEEEKEELSLKKKEKKTGEK